jgi:hypothetical protein
VGRNLLRGSEKPALELHRGHVLGLEMLREVVVGAPGVHLGAARVDVDRGEAEFRPGVDREVRFLDHDDAGDAVRVEIVEHDVDDGGLRIFRGADHDLFDFSDISDDAAIALVEFDEEMAAKCFQYFSFTEMSTVKSRRKYDFSPGVSRKCAAEAESLLAVRRARLKVGS